MLLTPHTFIGIAIGASVTNPFIAVPLAFLSHFLGDLTPHWDFFSTGTKEDRKTGWRPLAVMADLGLGIAVGLTATYYVLWQVGDPKIALSVFLCGVAAVLPDALEGPYIYMKKEPKILSYMTNLQRRLQTQAPLPWGMLTQFGVILASIYIFLGSF